MTANGENRTACWSKLDWLDPKWHGSAEEMVAFGRQCRDTKNWRTGITLLCADAHWRRAGMLGVIDNAYLATPEVWADIQVVYEEYLKHHPEDDIARTKYAMSCYLTDHFREAEMHYVTLGDRIKQWSEFPFVPLTDLKRMREHNARIVLGKEIQLTLPGWHSIEGANDGGEWHLNIPVEASLQEKPGILGAEASHVWNCSADGISYGIRVLNLPAALQNESHEHILELARSVVAKERGASPRNLHDTRLAARLAQEYDVDLDGLMQLRVKSIVIGNLFYELSVLASKSDVAGNAAREFFDSFAYQPKAK